jgi:hypothetical protein
LDGLFEFTIFSYIILGATCLVLFIYGLFLQVNHGPILLQDLIFGTVILALIILFYVAYERRAARTDSGLSRMAVLPYKFEMVVAWTRYISIGLIIIVAALAPWNLLPVSGFEFSIAGSILNYFFEGMPGSMINDLKKDAKKRKDIFPYRLTQLNYFFVHHCRDIIDNCRDCCWYPMLVCIAIYYRQCVS